MRPLTSDEIAVEGAAIHACWNSIGVRGDKSCPELAAHVHCRNCPAYASAATSLLDRVVVGPWHAAAAEDFADARDEEQAKDRSAIMFRIGQEWFALATQVLNEVVEMRALHALPHRRSPIVLGLVNVRGELVVCVSLARLLGVAEDSAGQCSTKAPRLLVLQGPGGRVAAPVDEVQHTHRYHEGELTPPAVTIARSQTSFTRALLAWGDRHFAVLDEVRLLDAVSGSLS